MSHKYGFRWVFFALFALATVLALATGGAFAQQENPPAPESQAEQAAPSQASSLTLPSQEAGLDCAQLSDPDALASMGGATELRLRTACGQPAAAVASPLQAPAQAPLSVQALGPDVPVNDRALDSGVAQTQSTTSSAINAVTGTICTAYVDSFHGTTEGLGYMGFSRSTDDGATFEDRMALDPAVINYGNPSMVWRASDGYFYLTALLDGTDGIGLWRSTDDCQNFTFHSYAHSGVLGGYIDDMEILAVDNTPTSPFYGRMYVVWVGESSYIWTSYSDDGANWLDGGIALSSYVSGKTSQTPWVAVAPNGDVYVTYVSLSGSAYSLPYKYDINVLRSTNGGNTFTARTSPLTAAIAPHDTVNSMCKQYDYQTVGLPALAGNIRYYPPPPQIVIGSDGIIHMVYSYDPDGANTGDVVDVFYRQSTDQGLTWGPQVRLNDDATLTDQFFPSISVSEEGRVVTSWYDRRNDPENNYFFEIFARTSYDNGATWAASQKVSDAQSPVVVDSDIALCYHGFYDQQLQNESSAYLFWADGRAGDQDVFAEKLTFPANFRLAAPASANMCTTAGASIALDLLSVGGYAEEVTLDVTGVPDGFTPSFAANPVIPSASTTLDLAVSGAPVAGTATLNITAAGASAAQSTNVVLNVFDANPTAPVLSAPVDAAIDVAALPTFTWAAVANAASYQVEVASDAAFTTVVYTETTTKTSLTPTVYLDPAMQYWWRVTANNGCGDTASAVNSFTTISADRILLIDGDDNTPDVLAYYTEPLDALGITYDVWDVKAKAMPPTEATLAAYTQAIWFTGDGYSGPTVAQEQHFANWMEHGSCLAISSQGAFTSLNAFRSQYLGLRGISSPTSAYTQVSGQWVVFGGLGPYTIAPPFSYSSPKIISVGGAGRTAFVSPEPNNTGAIVYTDQLQSTFWGFPLEGIAALAGRQEVIGALVNWCENGVEYGSVSGAVADGDYFQALTGAQVAFDDGERQFTFTTDRNGAFSGDLPAGTYTATASLAGYADATQSDIVVNGGANTLVDFQLFGSTLSVSPTAVDQTVTIGSTVDVPLTLSAAGPLPVDVNSSVFTTLDERIYGVYATYNPPPAFGYMHKDGEVITTLASFDLGTSPGGDFFGDDFSTVYAIANNGDYDPINDTVVAIDTATGAASVVGVIPAMEGYGEWVSMAYDPITSLMYLAGYESNLWGWPESEYLISLNVNTGQFGEIMAIITPYAGMPVGLGFDDAGTLYLHDGYNGALFKVDMADRTSELVGVVDVQSETNSGMDWDPATRQMYLSTWTTANGGELRTIDLTTAKTTLVSKHGSVDPGKPEETAFIWIAFATELVDWASVSPAQAVVPADGSAELTLTLDARRMAELGDYQATIGFTGSFIAPDRLSVPVDMHVVCEDCGTLDGDIFDEWTNQPVDANINITNTEGVDISLKGSSYQATVRPGTYTITAGADGYFDETVEVVAASGTTTTTDLNLLPMASRLEYTPAALDVEAQIGDVVTKQVTVENTGTVPMTFSMGIDNQDVPVQIANLLRSQINGSSAPQAAEEAPQIRAYGITGDGTDGALAWFNLADITNVTVSPITHPHGSMQAGDFWADDFSTLYATEESKLIALDTETGEKTIVGALPLISPYSRYDSMTYDPVSEQMYLLYGYDGYNPRSIYTVDVETAEVTLVGDITDTTVGLIQAIEFDDRGTLYGIDFDNNLLVTIDLDTMALSIIGELGFDAGDNYQGLSYDSASNQLILSSNNPNDYPFVSNLYTINVLTGEATLLGTIGSNFPGGGASVMMGLAIASEAQDWVEIPEDEFVLDAGESITLDLVFDTRSLYRTGVYSSDLIFRGDFSNSVAPLPVTLDLGCDGCAILKGSITDKADASPLPANLHIISENGFDVSWYGKSAYNLTVQPGDYDFTVALDGYLTQEKTITAAAGATTTTDFALVAFNNNIVVDPQSFEVEVPVGASITRSFTITNNGNVDFSFQMLDRETGEDPTADVPLTSCGEPDAFGYACLDSHAADGPAYAWLDISTTGTPLGLDGANDIYFPIDLPFDFSFYGEDYNQIAVTSYGQIYFEDKVSDPNWGGNQNLPADMGDGVNTFIALFWNTQFRFEDGSPSTYYEIQGVAPYRRLVISFENVPTYNPSWALKLLSFQAILFEGSNNILFQYGAMNGIDGTRGTVGIQGDVATATQFSYNTAASVTDDMAICFVHPDATLGQCGLDYPADASWMEQDIAGGELAVGESTTVEVTFDATGISEPGQFNGQIYFGGAWNAPLVIPVEMNVVSVTWSQDQVGRAAQGASVIYEVDLTNVGLVADTYALAANSEWNAQISYMVNGKQATGADGLSVTLDPQETITLLVTVTVPVNAAGGAQDLLTLTARSAQFEFGVDIIHLTTQAYYQVFMPFTRR